MTEAILVSAVAAIIGMGLTLVRRRHARNAVRHVAEALALEVSGARSILDIRASSASGGIRAEARMTALGRLNLAVSGIPSEFEIHVRPTQSARRVEMGDDRFPAVYGDPATALSCLSEEARERFVAERETAVLRLKNGRLECSLDPARVEIEEIARRLEALLRIAEAMVERPPGREALLHNALHDTVAGVRDRNATQLVSQFPTSPAARSFVETARHRPGSDDADWRTIASLLDPAARHDFLRGADSRDVARVVRATASPVLERLIDGLGASGKVGEGALVSLIASSPDDVRSNLALAVLSATASTAVIEPLRSARTFVSSAAFDRAIKDIKARAENAGDGQLSIAEGSAEAGSVSLAAHAGALSTPGGTRRD